LDKYYVFATQIGTLSLAKLRALAAEVGLDQDSSAPAPSAASPDMSKATPTGVPDESPEDVEAAADELDALLGADDDSA
jgi:hypothetical protein